MATEKALSVITELLNFNIISRLMISNYEMYLTSKLPKRTPDNVAKIPKRLSLMFSHFQYNSAILLNLTSAKLRT